ncbi:hypothetical protein LINPERPRIM_LOCUS18558 [Linum perenne]
MPVSRLDPKRQAHGIPAGEQFLLQGDEEGSIRGRCCLRSVHRNRVGVLLH